MNFPSYHQRNIPPTYNNVMHPYYGQMGQPVQPNFNFQQNHGRCISQVEVDYRNDMRSLWEEHVAWTRMAIISLVFDLPDIDEVLMRPSPLPYSKALTLKRFLQKLTP